MLVRVTWPNGNEREVEIHNQRDLDRFTSWHTEEGYRVAVERNENLLRLILSE